MKLPSNPKINRIVDVINIIIILSFFYGNSSVFINLSIVPSFSNVIIHKQTIIPPNIQRIANGIDKINPIKSFNSFNFPSSF